MLQDLSIVLHKAKIHSINLKLQVLDRRETEPALKRFSR